MDDASQRALDALLAHPRLAGRAIAGVWLFGSRARAAARDGSDVDLAVLCSPPLDLDRFALIDEIGRAAGVDIDLIDLPRSSATLNWEIVTTGRVVYEGDALACESFLRQARFAAEDAVPPRLAHLGSALAQLERLRDMPDPVRRGDPLLRLAAERGLHIAAEAVFDLGHHVLAGRGREVPDAYRDVLPALVAAAVVSEPAAARLHGLAGLRNLLVHEYAIVDADLLWALIDQRLPDLRVIEGEFHALPELSVRP